MSHIRIDNQKAMKKWSPVLENMGVTGDRVEWMSEYAEFHSINENAYVNASNVAGMGNVLAAQPGTYAGGTLAGTSADAASNYTANTPDVIKVPTTATSPTFGTLTVGANTLTISGSSPTRTSGTIDATNASATVAFTNGSAAPLTTLPNFSTGSMPAPKYPVS